MRSACREDLLDPLHECIGRKRLRMSKPARNSAADETQPRPLRSFRARA